ncbi:HNH endonuclease signature motif containing protein [Mycolicibacterium grossiae]|uniref:DUF222 domain-containing protein n=1 Tax=Mycolicibacterium grossiae TaxID=1552759 RepID=A0A1E8Q7P7_9MYCO|nr:HNH endonuclease signature motif containing protein [Mycolicibacterium grossiae]OFJ54130.1 hypothetical protein BEL07_08755 [Mycolicibacterium grossiae]
MTSSLADALTALEGAVGGLAGADVDGLSHRELLESYAALETTLRRVPAVQHALLARLDREATPTDLGATSLSKLLMQWCRIGKGDALRRLAWARLLGSRRALDGQELPPQLPQTAAAIADGAIGDDHVRVIKDFVAELPDAVDLETRIQAERTLAELARQVDPVALDKAANRLLAHLHPDGTLSDADRQRKAGLTLSSQQPDGMSRLSGWITPELRALLEPLFAKFAAFDARRPDPAGDPAATSDSTGASEATGGSDAAGPDADGGDAAGADTDRADRADADSADAAVPDVAGPDVAGPVDEVGPPSHAPLFDEHGRTQPRRQHDALLVMARMLLCRSDLGTLNGLPVSVVVTTTLQDLERGAGYAVTAGGSRLPMTDLIRMAAHAHHYLAVFDQHTSAALHLGRSQRCATGAQKLMLFARDRGCTCPGCDAAGYVTQAHHATADWKDDGQTNVDDMTLACGPDNRMVETTEWTTRRRRDGLVEWIPPPHLDTGQTRINVTHHPERLLAPSDDDPF